MPNPELGMIVNYKGSKAEVIRLSSVDALGALGVFNASESPWHWRIRLAVGGGKVEEINGLQWAQCEPVEMMTKSEAEADVPW